MHHATTVKGIALYTSQRSDISRRNQRIKRTIKTTWRDWLEGEHQARKGRETSRPHMERYEGRKCVVDSLSFQITHHLETPEETCELPAPLESSPFLPTSIHGSAPLDLPPYVLPSNLHPPCLGTAMDLDILPTTQHLGAEDEPDLIADGVITVQDAEGFFRSYRQRLDRFLYNILEEHDSLNSIRKSSPLLTAAVCVVGALHTFSPQYQACYEHLVQLASIRLFSTKNTSDDIRALCIAAFWLDDLSSSLIGAAVRLASELSIHRHIQNTPHRRDCYRNTRLFYIVCVCDRQLSITHGRPPLAWDFGSILSPKALLQSEYATKLDESLVSQLELWSINTQIFDRFYLDPDDDLPNGWIPLTQRLRTAVETWKVE